MTVLVFDVGGTEVKYSVIDDEIKPRNCGSFPTFKATVVPCTGFASRSDIYLCKSVCILPEA